MAGVRVIRFFRRLLDVDPTNLSPGKTIQTRASVLGEVGHPTVIHEYVDPAAGGGSTTLAALTDVSGGPPASGEAPVWDGDSFELTNVATQTELDALAGTVATDVELAAMLAQAVILDPQTSLRNVVAGPGDVIRQIWKAHAAQSVDLTQWQTSAGVPMLSIGPTGAVSIAPSSLSLPVVIDIDVGDPPTSGSDAAILVHQGVNSGGFTFYKDFGIAIGAPGGVLAADLEDRISVYDDLDNYLFTVDPTGRVGIRGYPTDDLLAVWATAGVAAKAWTIKDGGHEALVALSAIADGDVDTGERVQWFDDAVGAPLLRFKMRDSAGTLTSGISASQAYVDAADGLLVPKSLYDANTVLVANADDTPVALTMGASTILARLAAGDTKAASVAEIKTLLGIVDPAMALLSDSTLGADAASIDITGISGAYKHLMIVAALRSTRAGQTSDQGNIRFNNDSGANYYTEQLFGFAAVEDSSESIAATSGLLSWPGATAPADYFGPFTATVVNYASTTMRKSMNGQQGILRAESTAQVGTLASSFFWDSTAAIDRVTLFASNGNVLAGSRLTIYGMA